MDLVQLIRALEELVYEVALWPILLARTFIRFGFQPKKIFQYVNAELDKPADQRYRVYMSPLLYWLLVAVAPLFLMYSHILAATNDAELHNISTAPIEIRFVAVVIFLIWPPLSMATASLIFEMKWPTRESLRRPFYIQCMCLAPLYPVMGFIYPHFRDYMRSINFDQITETIMRSGSKSWVPDVLLVLVPISHAIVHAPHGRIWIVASLIWLCILVALELRLSEVSGGDGGSIMLGQALSYALLGVFYYMAWELLKIYSVTASLDRK